MGTKMARRCQGFKFFFQAFVVKEPELEIGHPTDVKHVTHIGTDGTNGPAPSWMNGFKNVPDFTATSPQSIKETKSPSSNVFNCSTSKAENKTAQKKHKPRKSTSTALAPKQA